VSKEENAILIAPYSEEEVKKPQVQMVSPLNFIRFFGTLSKRIS
jgi:hypothetical protein